MKLGYGYWSLNEIDRRIADLESRKPKRWKSRMDALMSARHKVLLSDDGTSLKKGWRGHSARKNRYSEMRRMYADTKASLADVGKEFGISRQRVHQILSNPQWK
jgi:DNA-directed RNA polymerase sigma subunit (sigma70/sigma32)